MRPEIVVDGIRFGEGPAWCPDGTLAVVSVADGVVWRVDPAAGTKAVLGETRGGPNAAAAAGDGGVLVTQNGGIDYARFPGVLEDPPPYRPVLPGLQRIAPDGAVSYLVAEGFHAPNDLVVAGDGTVFFTDPPHFPPPREPVGRVWAWHAARGLSLVADGFRYCNGIALDGDGALVIVDATGLLRLRDDGSREWVVEDLGPGGGDGFCVDAANRFYVAGTAAGCVRVVEDGRVVDVLDVPGGRLVTNCCFGGPDGRSLFATDGVAGTLVVWEGMPTQGLPLHLWSP